MQELFQDFLSSICRGLVISMVVSLVFIVLLRFLAGIMIWVMIVLVILVLGYGELNQVWNLMGYGKSLLEILILQI